MPTRNRTRRQRPASDQMAAGVFKAKCLEVMDAVNRQRTTVVITKHGRPVARLVPPDHSPASPIGALAGSVVRGDLVRSDPKAWRAARDPLDRDPARG